MSERFTGNRKGLEANGVDSARPVFDAMVIPSTLLMLSLAAWKPNKVKSTSGWIDGRTKRPKDPVNAMKNLILISKGKSPSWKKK